MEIIDNSNNQCFFREIDCGDVFKTESCYYLKMQKTTCSSFSTGYLNAVNLENGNPASFEGNDIIIRMKGKVVIE